MAISELERLWNAQGTPIKREGTQVGDTAVSLVDADTARVGEGENIRIKDVDAPEVKHFNTSSFDFDDGEVSGQLVTDATANIIEKEGFTNESLQTQDRPGPNFITGERVRRGFYGRPLGDLVTDSGQHLSSRLLSSGLATVDRFGAQSNYDGTASNAVVVQSMGALDRAVRKAEGTENDTDRVVNMINQNRINKSLDTYGSAFVGKPMAVSESVFSRNPDLYSGVSIRDDNRSLMNETRGIQLDDAFASGKKQGMLGIYTSMGLIGEMLDIDSMDNWGQGNANRIKREIEDLPQLKNVNAFDPDTGEWTLDGISEFTSYIGTNFASSLPIMGITLGAAVLAVPTYGASLAVPASIYTGLNYDSQAKDDKHIAKAFGYGVLQTSLDLLTVYVPVSKLSSFFTNSATRKEVVKEVAKKYGTSNEAAEKLLAQTMRKQAERGVEITADQMKRGIKKKSARLSATGINVGASASIEGFTEATQEILSVFAENSTEPPENLHNRLLNSFSAGFFLGGGFGAAGEAMSAGKQYNERVGVSDSNRVLEKDQAVAFDKGKELDVLGARQANTNVGFGPVKDDNSTASLAALADLEPDANDPAGVIDRGARLGLKALQGQVSNIFSRVKNNGPIMNRLASIYGAVSGRAGGNLEERQQMITANYSGKQQFDERIMISESPFRNKKQFAEHVYSPENQAKYGKILKMGAKTRKLTVADIKNKAGIELDTWEVNFLQAVLDSNRQASIDSGTEVNILSRGFSGSRVYSNQTEFENLLVSEYKIPRQDAERMSQIFSSTEEYTTPKDIGDDMLNLDSNAIDVKALGDVTQNPAFSRFLEPDPFVAIANNSNKAAAKVINSQFIGANGAFAASDLNKAYSNGEITYNERIQLARGIQKYHAQKSGTDNVIRSKAYNRTMNIVTTTTALTYLGKAVISSIPEIGTVIFNGNPNKMKAVYTLAKTAAKEMTALVNESLNSLSGGRVPMREYEHRKELRAAGYLADQQSPAARVGAEYSPAQAILVNNFFRWTGLNSLTNLQRSVRLSIARDAIQHWEAQGALHMPEAGQKPNKFYQEARDQLSRLGLDADKFITQAYINDVRGDPSGQGDSKAEVEAYEEQLKVGAIRFVDMAIAMPRKGNRPAFYSDPRFRMFTMFQGYTSTVTATILPQIFKDLGGKESMPAARVQAITTMTSMLALAFLSIAMKDALTGKEEKEEREGDDFKHIMRGIYSSGLVGTAQRPIDAIFPLYGEKNSLVGKGIGKVLGNTAGEVTDSVISESVALNYLDDLGKAVEGHISDDDNKWRRTLNVTPLAGTMLKDRVTPYELK